MLNANHVECGRYCICKVMHIIKFTLIIYRKHQREKDRCLYICHEESKLCSEASVLPFVSVLAR